MSTGNALYQRHFLRLMDFTPAELQALLRLSADLKQAKKQGQEQRRLQGKTLRSSSKRLDPHAMLFRSCRIRSGRAGDLPRPERQPDRP